MGIDADVPRRFKGFRALVVGASFVVLVAGLKAGAALLIPFLFAFFLAILGAPPIDWLCRKKVPKLIAVLLVTFIFVSILVGSGAVIASSVNEFSDKIPDYKQSAISLRNHLVNFLETYRLDNYAASALDVDAISPGAVIEMVGTTFKGLVAYLSKVFLVIFILIFMLFESADLRPKLAVAFGKGLDPKHLSQVAIDVQRYLVIKTTTSAITGLVIFSWTSFMGIDFPLLWGFSAFFVKLCSLYRFYYCINTSNSSGLDSTRSICCSVGGGRVFRYQYQH